MKVQNVVYVYTIRAAKVNKEKHDEDIKQQRLIKVAGKQKVFGKNENLLQTAQKQKVAEYKERFPCEIFLLQRGMKTRKTLSRQDYETLNNQRSCTMSDHN